MPDGICVMLDVDGVLLHPEDGESWASGLERDLGLSPARLAEGFFAPHWEAVVRGQRGLIAALEESLPAIAPHLTARELIDYWFAKDGVPDGAVMSAIDRLRQRGHRVILTTNQEPLRARWLMEDMGMEGRVDGLACSGLLGCRKPEKAFFAGAARIAGAAPDRLLLVDDAPANVAAARAAGWRAVQWQPGADLPALVARAGKDQPE